ncbi:MAG TPA: hypothetical protein VJT31_27300, partial [Rugosimonospora sp.]|nr:hypothetical protein [Rugosimonospora sp.]
MPGDAARRYADRVAAGLPARLNRLARGMYLVVLAPYLLVVPLVVLLRWPAPRHEVTAGEALGDVLMPLVALGVCLAAPYALLTRDWGAYSYTYRCRRAEMTPIDWSQPRWRGIGEALTGWGVDPAGLSAVSVFTPYANLATVHMPGVLAGWYRAMSDWATRHHRRLTWCGLAVGFSLGLVDDLVRPQWPRQVYHSAAFGVLLVTVTVLLVPLSAVIGYRMYVRNVRDGRMTVVIPTQWRRLLRSPQAPYVPLLAHEVSHVRHRDAHYRRYLAFYSTGA